MIEDNPWKTPFGRLLIGSSIVAAIVGFSLAAGVTTYFKTDASTVEEEFVSDVDEQRLPFSDIEQEVKPATSQRSLINDPEGYAEALAGLGPPPEAEQAVTDGSDGAEQDSNLEGSIPPEVASEGYMTDDQVSEEAARQ